MSGTIGQHQDVARREARGGDVPALRLATVCIDCADAHEMAAFYGRLLGWVITRSEPNWVLMRDPAGGTGLSFQAEEEYRPPTWPERADEQAKMLHLDIRVDDLDAAVEHAIAAGARLAEHQPQERVRVLFDPAGHPLCLFLD
jgi:catechol 2,3-dioxygenase-like lactoylglutathione lyase family enzyme